MAYGFTDHPHFTEWVVKNRLLKEPLILVDIGVQGGHHRRWEPLGDDLHVHGFDGLSEVIAALTAANKAPNRLHYHHLGLGNEDGERLFERVANTFGSAFLPTTATESDIGRDKDGHIPGNWSTVQIRKLDTLFKSGLVPKADVLKMDCEGFEIEIAKGAQAFLSQSGVFAIESETHFFPNPMSPRSHFVELYEQLLPLGFEAFDCGFYRTPKTSPDQPRQAGRIDTFDFLFMGRDIYRREPMRHSIDRIIKMAIVCELYCLNECAIDILRRGREILSPRFDTDEAISLIGGGSIPPDDLNHVHVERRAVDGFLPHVLKRIAAIVAHR